MSHQQRAQRETAIAAAEGMLRDLEDRLPDASHRACSEFKDALAKLQEWDDAVREKQSSLRFPHDAIRQARQIAAFRQASLRLESDLDAFVSALQQVEDWVVLAAEGARQASEAAAKGTQVDPREEGRAALQETLQHVAGVRDAAARAEASLDVVAEAADAFLQNLRSLAAWPRQRVQDAQSALHQIQEARNALKQREELEVEWRQRYRRLSSAVARMQSIHAEFERGSQRIQAELASHPPNEPIDAVHQRLHQLRSKLECLENNFHIWASPTGSGCRGFH